MRRKLGLTLTQGADEQLIAQLLACMQHTGVDFTIAFRSLSQVGIGCSGEDMGVDSGVKAFLDVVLPTCAEPSAMAARMRSRINQQHLMLLQQVARTQPEMLDRIGITAEV
jgi:uncharacterized protein YdiU (UPF0061 family)